MKYRYVGIFLSSIICLELVTVAGLAPDSSDNSRCNDADKSLNICSDSAHGSTTQGDEYNIPLRGKLDCPLVGQIEITGIGNNLDLFEQVIWTDETTPKHKSSSIGIKNNSHSYVDVYINRIASSDKDNVAMGILDAEGNIVHYKGDQEHKGARWECNLAEIPGRYLFYEKLPPGESCELFVITICRSDADKSRGIEADLVFSFEEVSPPSSSVSDNSEPKDAEHLKSALDDDKVNDKKVISQPQDENTKDGNSDNDKETEPQPQSKVDAAKENDLDDEKVIHQSQEKITENNIRNEEDLQQPAETNEIKPLEDMPEAARKNEQRTWEDLFEIL
ncbi:hypothetical protein FACS189481_5160 [Clostridia bacterium]|nr:hypothetical protein FACS189481_5160 [Clostridia bacterium]